MTFREKIGVLFKRVMSPIMTKLKVFSFFVLLTCFLFIFLYIMALIVPRIPSEWFAFFLISLGVGGLVTHRRYGIRRRTIIVLFALFAVIALFSGSSGPEPVISGKIAGDEVDTLDDRNRSATHTVELDHGDTLRIEFEEEGSVIWTISLPNNETHISTTRPGSVKRTDEGTIRYTANQNGIHQISLSAEPYYSTSYKIYIEENE